MTGRLALQAGAHLAEQIEPVAVLQAHVEQDAVVLLARERLARLGEARRGHRPVPLATRPRRTSPSRTPGSSSTISTVAIGG